MLIVVIHLIPVTGLDSSSWWSEIHLDKIVHVFAFAVFSLSISIAFTKLRLFLYKTPILMMIILVGCTGFGTILEIIQGELIDGRTADFLDIVADCVGFYTRICCLSRSVWSFSGPNPPRCTNFEF